MTPYDTLREQLDDIIIKDGCSHQTPVKEFQLRLLTKFNVESTEDEIEITLMGLKYHVRSK